MFKFIKNLLLICALSAAGHVSAHHSFAVHFYGDRTITVSGTVTEYRFTNPHGVLLFTVIDENGEEEVWQAETNSPSVLRRRGWAKDSLKVGDEITIEGFPGRTKEHYMRISRIDLPDGSSLHAQAKAD